MAIELIDKIAPKNDGFVGMLDADQVIGGGASGTLPDAAVAASNVTQHVTSNASHTGDVVGSTSLTIQTDAVDIPMLSATGTASATTYLRGDNTWATPAGGSGDSWNTPIDSNITVDTNSTYTIGTNTNKHQYIYADNLVVGDYIIHNNDLNTLIGFTTDVITLKAGGINSLVANASGVSVTGNITATNLSGSNSGDQTISDATISITDITTNNVSSSKHGFAPKGDGSSTSFLNGTGAYSTPSGGGNVSKFGTPVNDQVGVWTGDGIIEGTTGLTYDGTHLSSDNIITSTLNSTASTDVICFGDTDVADDASGKALYIHRKAVEGDNYMKLYTSPTREGRIVHDGNLAIDSGASNEIRFNHNTSGDIRLGTDYLGPGTNQWVRQFGYITAATASKYAEWKVDDTDDYFHLSRQDSNLLGFKVDMPLEATSLVTPTINATATADVDIFGSTDVDDADDGKRLRIWRKAAEGDEYLQMFVNRNQNTIIDSTGGMYLSSDEAVNLQHSAYGNVNIFSESGSGDNLSVLQYGWITAASNRKYVQWEVSDTDDYFHLKREDSNILGFKVDMPLSVTGDITLSGNIDNVDLATKAIEWDDKVEKVNTPVDNQIAVWTDDSTVEGTTGLTYTGSQMDMVGDFYVKQAATSPSKEYRFRTSGSSLDFDFDQAHMYFSGYPSTNFGGTQYNHFRLYHDQQRVDCLGNWQWQTGTSYSGDILFKIDKGTSTITVGAPINGITTTEFGYLDNVSSNIQDQIDAKISNVNHTGDIGGSTVTTLNSTAISGKALVTAIGADHVIILDATDGNLKKALISDFASAGGDMAAATYDPTTVAGDAFDMDNMVEGTAKILTTAERTKLTNTTNTNSGDNATNTQYSSLVTNVTTNLSEGTSSTTTVDVNSSDGTNATLLSASTSRAGILTKAKFDEIGVNTAKAANFNHTGDATGNEALTLATVNSNVGTFTNADITVNAKGLITAASNGTGGSGGISWNEVVGTTQAASVDNGYICNNAGLVTVTLPDTAALGSVVRISGKGAGGWKLAQNASETVHFGNTDTTTGTGGSLASTQTYDAIELVCVTANTDWVVVSSVGNITVV